MIKYYYEDKYTKIILGDCQDYVTEIENSDLLLTDPPYGIGEASNSNKSRGNLTISKDYGCEDWDDKPIAMQLMQSWIDKTKYQIIFGGNYYQLPPTKCWLIWDKVNYGTDFADIEMAWTNLNHAARLYQFQWNGMLQGDMKHKDFRYHPTQKPTSVMKWCLGQVKDQRKLINLNSVIDPFMGAGTTLVACKQMNINCIGIERMEIYAEAAAKRLSQEVLDLGI
jgi:DNA modification methylase